MATSSVALRPLGKVKVAVSSQSGAPFGTRFWKKNSPLDAVDEALHRPRPLAQLVDGGVGDREVVLGEVELGEAFGPAFGKKTLSGLDSRTSRPAASIVV